MMKCIIADIDGTIVNSNNKVTSYTRKVICKYVDNGGKVILASGRYIDDVIEISKRCGASSIIISDNGSIIYDYEKNEYLYQKRISKNKLKIIYNLCLKYSIDIIFNSKGKRYRIYKQLDISYNEPNDIIIKDISEIKDDIFQVIILGIDKYKFNCCLQQIRDNNLIVSNCGKGKNKVYFADINIKSASKGKAIKKICKLINIKKSEIICFGDSKNDIEMFENCGIKVAMKNAIKELKEKADFVTEFTNNDDGVAKFLKSNNYMI